MAAERIVGSAVSSWIFSPHGLGLVQTCDHHGISSGLDMEALLCKHLLLQVWPLLVARRDIICERSGLIDVAVQWCKGRVCLNGVRVYARPKR